jgi:hypothetical protein
MNSDAFFILHMPEISSEFTKRVIEITMTVIENSNGISFDIPTDRVACGCRLAAASSSASCLTPPVVLFAHNLRDI